MAERARKKTSEKKQDKKPENKPKKRSHPLLWILLIAVVWWFNNYTLRTNHEEMTTSKLSKPVKIGIISDLHATAHGISNRTIFEAVDSEHPDIVFFLGDMYTRKSEWELIQKPVDLAGMFTGAGYPLYCVTGEHDYDDRYIAEMNKAGARVLSYGEEYVDTEGGRLHIMGIDNVYYSHTFDLSTEFTLDESCFNILLAHIPNYEKFADFGADLTLCGDTHGDMAQLPFGMGPVYSSETKTWLPKLLHKELDIYDKGFFDYDGGRLFVTSGIGVYPAPVRFNNRPEVVIMEISPKG